MYDDIKKAAPSGNGNINPESKIDNKNLYFKSLDINSETMLADEAAKYIFPTVLPAPFSQLKDKTSNTLPTDSILNASYFVKPSSESDSDIKRILGEGKK